MPPPVLPLKRGRGDLRWSSVAVALVVGVEKMTDVTSARRRYWLGVSGDTEWERLAGLTFAGVYGLIASRYLDEYHASREALAEVAVKNHENGALNPKAQFQKRIRREDVLNAPRVAEPLGLLDCCPVSDGAVALLVAELGTGCRSLRTPRSGSRGPVLGRIRSRFKIASVDELSSDSSCAAEAVFRSGRSTGSGLSLLEVHDCFTIAELLAIEDLGFARSRWRGCRLTLQGATQRRTESSR